MENVFKPEHRDSLYLMLGTAPATLYLADLVLAEGNVAVRPCDAQESMDRSTRSSNATCSSAMALADA